MTRGSLSTTIVTTATASVASVAVSSFLETTLTKSIIASATCGAVLVASSRLVCLDREHARMLMIGTTGGLSAGILFDKIMARAMHWKPSAPIVRNTLVATAVLAAIAWLQDRYLIS